jgi:hypothetical protein
VPHLVDATAWLGLLAGLCFFAVGTIAAVVLSNSILKRRK